MNATARIPTDLVTPLGAYLRLRRLATSGFLLESVEQGRLGRYSFVGCGSRLVSFDGAEQETAPVVGYLGYDYVARLEPTVPLPTERPDLPESRFVVAEVLVRIDHVSSTAEVLAGDPAEIAVALAAHADEPSRGPLRGRPTRRTPDRQEHERRVRRAKESIVAGDAFQIVLSQRAERRTDASAVALYRALRRINPSPYLFLLELGDVSLVGSSPETHVKLEGARASLNPIAGTIAAGEGAEESLLASEKDRAEHVMLVDLGRNDLSRVCVPGTVRVVRLLEPEHYSHVVHLVSEVAGEIQPGRNAFDLLRATFPAGTVSGAPKIRALEIIQELEPHKRNIYAGAIGYIGWWGDADTAIAIRTAVIQDGRLHVQAGGGIVYDSDPATEWEETMNKGRALFRAVAQAAGGL